MPAVSCKSLPASAAQDEAIAAMDAAAADLRWAVAVAAVAELLRGSPFRSIADRATIEALLDAAVAGRPERAEALPALKKALALLVDVEAVEP